MDELWDDLERLEELERQRRLLEAYLKVLEKKPNYIR